MISEEKEKRAKQIFRMRLNEMANYCDDDCRWNGERVRIKLSGELYGITSKCQPRKFYIRLPAISHSQAGIVCVPT